MNTTHTPGSWTYKRIAGGYDVVRGQQLIAACGGAGDYACEQAEANARLIAPAPDLLDALKAVVSCWGVKAIGMDDFIEDARAAIAKAEGITAP